MKIWVAFKDFRSPGWPAYCPCCMSEPGWQNGSYSESAVFTSEADAIAFVDSRDPIAARYATWEYESKMWQERIKTPFSSFEEFDAWRIYSEGGEHVRRNWSIVRFAGAIDGECGPDEDSNDD